MSALPEPLPAPMPQATHATTPPQAPAYAPAPFTGGPPAVVHVHVAQKSMAVAYLLLLFLGGLGIHRFYLNRTGTGLAMLLIFLLSLPLAIVLVGFIGLAIVGIWGIVDLFLVPGMIREENAKITGRYPY